MAFYLEGAVRKAYKPAGRSWLHLHVFFPPSRREGDRHGGIVLFFGGGWQAGTPAQFAPQCRHLAGRGMVAIAAEYRVRARHGTTAFESVADGRSALRWVRRHAQELGVDPSRLAAGGGSAGGHVAACTALAAEGVDEPGEDLSAPCRPDALVLFNPVLDTVSLPLAAERLGQRARDISPMHHVAPGAPPAIVFHGRADQVVPFAQAERFAEAMRQAGCRCEAMGFEGEGHGFFNLGRGDGSCYRRTLEATERFLESLGFLPR